MSEIETVTTKKKSWKKWVVPLGIIILLSMVYSCGSSAAKVEIEGEKVTYDELVASISEKESEITDVEKQLADIQKELDDNKAKFDEALAIIEDKESAQNELGEINRTIESKQVEVTELDNTIKSKNDELASLEGRIKETGEKPIELSAGQYLVGSDFPPGRYKAEPIGDGSNFVVYDSTGSLAVNTILGRNGVPEYIFITAEGYYVETEARVKLTPVQ